MRRVALVLAVLALLGAAAGCGSQGTTRALPETVVGTLPKAPTQGAVPPGNPAVGKALFASQGCGGCHTFKPAGSGGTVGPNLGNLAADAKKANQGSVDQYAFDSIKNPSSYVVPGFQAVMPDFASLGDKKIADLVAFLTKS
jgi:cytochrome c oxidase subunit II